MNKSDLIRRKLEELVASGTHFKFLDVASEVGASRELVRQIAKKDYGIVGRVDLLVESFCKYCNASLGTRCYGAKICNPCREQRAAKRKALREKYWYVKGRLLCCKGCGTTERKDNSRHATNGYCMKCAYHYDAAYKKRISMICSKSYQKNRKKRNEYNRLYLRIQYYSNPEFKKRLVDYRRTRYQTNPEFRRKCSEASKRSKEKAYRDPVKRERRRMQRREYARKRYALKKLLKQNATGTTQPVSD